MQQNHIRIHAMIFSTIINRIIIICILSNSTLLAFDIVMDINHVYQQLTPTFSSSCQSGRTYNVDLSRYIIGHVNKNISVEMKIKNMDSNDSYYSHMYKDLLIGIYHGSVQKQYIKNNSFGCPVSTQGSGYSIFISRKNPHYSKSLYYAKMLAIALKEEGLSPSLHHNDKIIGENKETADVQLGIYFFDDLALLKNSKMPALVLEPGIIVNPADDLRVRSESFKSKISNAISRLQ